MSTRDRWIEIVNKWKKSGEAIAASWCKKNRIHYPSFITWRKRLGQTTSIKKEETSFFIEVVEEKKTACTINLKYKDVSLEIENEFDETLVRKCLNLIKSL